MRNRSMVVWGVALAALIAGAAHAVAEGPTEEELRACLQGNVPSTSDLRSLKLTSVDRIGQQSVTQVLVLARPGSEGSRSTLIRFTAPEELVGSAQREEYVPTPGAGCHTCDFTSFCPAGREYLDRGDG